MGIGGNVAQHPQRIDPLAWIQRARPTSGSPVATPDASRWHGVVRQFAGLSNDISHGEGTLVYVLGGPTLGGNYVQMPIGEAPGSQLNFISRWTVDNLGFIPRTVAPPMVRHVSQFGCESWVYVTISGSPFGHPSVTFQAYILPAGQRNDEHHIVLGLDGLARIQHSQPPSLPGTWYLSASSDERRRSMLIPTAI